MFGIRSVFVRALPLAVVGLLFTGSLAHAQPAGPQGTGWIGGGNSSQGTGYSGSYSTPSYSGYSNYAPAYTAPAATPGYQANYPTRQGWDVRSDGWYYYWNQDRLVGAYDPQGDSWYAYNDNRWGQASRAPWKQR